MIGTISQEEQGQLIALYKAQQKGIKQLSTLRALLMDVRGIIGGSVPKNKEPHLRDRAVQLMGPGCQSMGMQELAAQVNKQVEGLLATNQRRLGEILQKFAAYLA